MTNLHTAAQQDIPDLIAGAFGVSRGTAYDMMREALAEAQQEPVAWIEHEWSGTGLKHLHFERRDPILRDEVVNPVWTPLYTSPPQRTLVGLTDEEIARLDLSAVTVKDAISDVRAIEAKLKEKNT